MESVKNSVNFFINKEEKEESVVETGAGAVTDAALPLTLKKERNTKENSFRLAAESKEAINFIEDENEIFIYRILNILKNEYELHGWEGFRSLLFLFYLFIFFRLHSVSFIF